MNNNYRDLIKEEERKDIYQKMVMKSTYAVMLMMVIT